MMITNIIGLVTIVIMCQLKKITAMMQAMESVQQVEIVITVITIVRIQAQIEARLNTPIRVRQLNTIGIKVAQIVVFLMFKTEQKVTIGIMELVQNVIMIVNTHL